MRRLVTAITVVVAIVTSWAPVEVGEGCEANGYFQNCETSNTGSGIDIGATITQPGDGGGSGTSDSIGGETDEGSLPTAPEEKCVFDPCRGNYEVWVIPEVTLADLASFVPAGPTLSGEPAGLGVVGMPTNFVASASEQQLTGEIFDRKVVVRFTPDGFRFSYGDGATRAAPDGGASWPALGQAEFTPTATSHAYGQRGLFPASVTVLYTPAVNFGGGWRPVTGHVEATTGGYEVRVVEVHTALVDRTCTENPRGPGC